MLSSEKALKQARLRPGVVSTWVSGKSQWKYSLPLIRTLFTTFPKQAYFAERGPHDPVVLPPKPKLFPAQPIYLDLPTPEAANPCTPQTRRPEDGFQGSGLGLGFRVSGFGFRVSGL